MKKITKIVYIEKAPVYDLAVKKNKNFITDSAILHNCDYKGEICVIADNKSDSEDIKINTGDRIAQIVIQAVEQLGWEEVDNIDDLPPSDRGEGGFGSTGTQ